MPKKREKLEERFCKRPQCAVKFTPPKTNKSQEYCCRSCAAKGRERDKIRRRINNETLPNGWWMDTPNFVDKRKEKHDYGVKPANQKIRTYGI